MWIYRCQQDIGSLLNRIKSLVLQSGIFSLSIRKFFRLANFLGRANQACLRLPSVVAFFWTFRKNDVAGNVGSIAVVVGVIWNDVLCVHFVDEMSPVAKDGSGSCIITRPRRHISVGNWKVVMHNFCECVIRKGFSARWNAKILTEDWSTYVLLTW